LMSVPTGVRLGVLPLWRHVSAITIDQAVLATVACQLPP
jgi:hypothetical protein